MKIAVLFNDDAEVLSFGEEKDRVAVAGAGPAAAAIAAALAARGRTAISIPVRTDALEVAARLRAARPDAVFNVCEGFAGRSRAEGAVAGLLDLLRIPYTGSPPAALFLAQDKARSKAVLRAAGVPVPAGGVLARAGGPLPAGLRWPAFVKTRYEDASHGISGANVCADEGALRARAAELIEMYRQDALVEEFLPGRELNAAVLGDEVLPLSEIDFSKVPAGRPPVVTYDAKWMPASIEYRSTPAVCPAPLEDGLGAEVERLARAAFAALGCRGYARVDLRLDRDGRPVVLEVNPNPDLSPDAGFARSAARAGMSHEDLIERILDLALGTS